jgi:hypothetical protein
MDLCLMIEGQEGVTLGTIVSPDTSGVFDRATVGKQPHHQPADPPGRGA